MSNTKFLPLIFFLLIVQATTVKSQTEAVEIPADQSDFSVYIGLDYFKGETEQKVTVKGDLIGSERTELDQDGVRFKWGAILKNSWRIQGSFKNEEVEYFDNDVYGIGMDVIKGFPVTSHFSPFIQTGVGYDWTELGAVESLIASRNSMKAFTLKLGAGVLYEFADTVEVMAGIDWQYRSWDRVNLSDSISSIKIETEDTAETLYVGLNLLF